MPIANPSTSYANATSDTVLLSQGRLMPAPDFAQVFDQPGHTRKQVDSELWRGWILKTFAAPRLDKWGILKVLDQVKGLEANWNGYKAIPIDRQVIKAAREFIVNLPADIALTPKVVPMTKGRLQFEWHRGSRSLELEFAGGDQIHYLKWDSTEGIEDEGVIPLYNAETICSLLRWFSAESVNG